MLFLDKQLFLIPTFCYLGALLINFDRGLYFLLFSRAIKKIKTKDFNFRRALIYFSTIVFNFSPIKATPSLFSKNQGHAFRALLRLKRHFQISTPLQKPKINPPLPLKNQEKPSNLTYTPLPIPTTFTNYSVTPLYRNYKYILK